MAPGGLDRNNLRPLACKPVIQRPIAPRHCLPADMDRHNQFTVADADVHPPVPDNVGRNLFDKLRWIGRHEIPPHSKGRAGQVSPFQAVSSMNKLTKVSFTLSTGVVG